MTNLTASQNKTLDTIKKLTANGPLNVTYGGIKGVNRNSMFTLEEKGLIVIERIPVAGRNYPDMLASLA